MPEPDPFFNEPMPPQPIINAVGYATRVGGSCPHPEVLRAMQSAQERYFEIDDLLAHASCVIARRTGAEAGIVTCGASAALTLGAAAILAGDDVARMEALPEVSGLPRHTFLYPVPGRYDYDHPVRASGARLRPFPFDAPELEERLRAALTTEVAGVVYVWKHGDDGATIRRIAAICREAGVPFLLDAAMALPPAENLRELIRLGPDLVALSGGKHLGGPQNSGLLFGRAALVRSAWLQMVDLDVRSGSWSLGAWLEAGHLPRPPRHGLGRGFKVGKDTILGCVAALERYPLRDFAAERTRWHSLCAAMAGALSGLSRFHVEYLRENGTGQYPVVRLTAPDADAMKWLKKSLKSQPPKIILAEDDHHEAVAYLYPMCLSDAEANLLVERLTTLLTSQR